jgi:hypothetical protein
MVHNPNRRTVVAGLGSFAAGFGLRPQRVEAQSMNTTPDLILFNGKITTPDRQNPQADARLHWQPDSRQSRRMAGPKRRHAGLTHVGQPRSLSFSVLTRSHRRAARTGVPGRLYRQFRWL